MTFPESIQTCLAEKYMDFSGRADRSEYWWFFLFQLLLNVVVSLTAAISENLSAILTLIVGLGLLLPGLAVAVRRLHDTNRSGWWLLLMLIPILGWIWLIVLYLIKGDEGPNDY